MATRFPTLFVNVGYNHYYLRSIRPPEDIGIVASAAYPPDPYELQDPSLRVAMRLLDPLTYQLQLPSADQNSPFRRLPYAASSVDSAALSRDPVQRAELIRAVAGQSHLWGADRIVSPYFHAVDPDDPAFEASLVMASETLSRFGAAGVLPAIFIHQNSLLPQHVEDLLNRLTGTDFDSLYLLVGVDLPSTAPISSDHVLAGIRFVVEILAKNGINVIWGATDTTGLLAAAWAPGTSYALGPETFLRRRKQAIQGLRRGGFNAPTTRVFAAELLSELKVADYQAWTSAGRLPCGCAACAQRGPVAGRLGYYVNCHADLTIRLERATDPPRALAQMIDSAIRQVGTGPVDADARRHLNHWRAQLP